MGLIREERHGRQVAQFLDLIPNQAPHTRILDDGNYYFWTSYSKDNANIDCFKKGVMLQIQTTVFAKYDRFRFHSSSMTHEKHFEIQKHASKNLHLVRTHFKLLLVPL